MAETRKTYIEAMRILAMLFVIFNHTNRSGFFLFSAYETGSLLFWLNLANSVFCKFGASLFFVISGALMLHKPQESIKKLYAGRVLKYILILIAISVVYAITDTLLKRNTYTISSFFQKLYSGGLRASSWFLYAYIAFLMLLPFLRALVQNLDDKYFAYMIMCYLAFKLIHVIEFLLFKGETTISNHIVFNLPVNAFVLPCVGYYLERRLDIKKWGGKIWLLWGVNILLIILTCVMTYMRRQYLGGGYTEAKDQVFHSHFVVINCISIYISLKLLCERIHLSNRVNTILCLIGGTTFGVYLLHPVLCFIEPFASIISFLSANGVPTFIACWVYIICLFSASSIITLLVRKLPAI